MTYAFRRAVPTDTLSFIDVAAACYGGDQDVHSALPEFWNEMVASGAMIAAVSLDVHDLSQPEIVAFGASLMARREFVEYVQAQPAGGYGEHAVRWWMRGCAPNLTIEEIHRSNFGEGSDAVVLHTSFLRGGCMACTPPEIVECQYASFFEFHRGIKFRSFHQSCSAADEFHWMLGSGLRHRPRPGELVPPLNPTSEVPALVGARNDELPLIWGSRAARMFALHLPRLQLKPMHRELLQPALCGLTDEELAEELCLSLSAIKKRWAALYDHLAEVCPSLFPEPDRCVSGGTARGGERRRHLLQYLRQHPEELNPQAG